MGQFSIFNSKLNFREVPNQSLMTVLSWLGSRSRHVFLRCLNLCDFLQCNVTIVFRVRIHFRSSPCVMGVVSANDTPLQLPRKWAEKRMKQQLWRRRRGMEIYFAWKWPIQLLPPPPLSVPLTFCIRPDRPHACALCLDRPVRTRGCHETTSRLRQFGQ